MPKARDFIKFPGIRFFKCKLHNWHIFAYYSISQHITAVCSSKIVVEISSNYYYDFGLFIWTHFFPQGCSLFSNGCADRFHTHLSSSITSTTSSSSTISSSLSPIKKAPRLIPYAKPHYINMGWILFLQCFTHQKWLQNPKFYYNIQGLFLPAKKHPGEIWECHKSIIPSSHHRLKNF